LFDELISCGLGIRRGREKLCRRLLECLLLKIGSVRAPLEGEETIAFNTYQQCRLYIEQHFQKLRTLEEIAGDCHVNDAYLCRLFRRFDHQSPYQFLLRLKMNRAAEQLHQQGRLIKQISEELGFADPFHFSRVFKKVLGVAPNEFRKMR
jgi:AraC-like DNA-binding protein